MGVIVQPNYSGLDNTINQITPNTGDVFYSADNGVISAQFFQAGNKVIFERNDRTITWVPQSMKYVDESGLEDAIYSVQDVPLETKANYARINRSMPDIDDWFIVDRDRVKHQILVQGFQRDPAPFLIGSIDFVIGGSLSFDSDLRIVANGLTLTGPFETEGSIDIYDGDTILFTLPQVIAYDSAYNRTETTGKYRVTQNEAGNLAFDIVVDNGWMSSTDRVYPVVIDPTVVASSAYSITKQGKKIVELSNGWLVAVALGPNNPCTAYFYKSEDKGQTWSQLTYISGVLQATTFQVALASIGTNCVLLYVNSSPVSEKAVTFDATTVTNTDQASTAANIESLSVYSPDGFTLTTDGNGNYLGAYAGTVSGALYSSIRFLKSPDGRAWTVSQAAANSQTNVISPFILVDNSNNVYLYAVNNQTITVYFGANFANSKAILSQSGIASPQGVVDKNGALWMVAVSGTTFYCYKSTDGAYTWTQVTLPALGSNPANPSLTTDPTAGDLYMFYTATNGSYTAVYYVKYTASTGTWGNPVLADSNASGNLSWPNALYSNFNRNYNSAIRWLYMDTQANAVKYDSITLNVAPNAPTLTPHGNFDASTQQTFSWVFDDPNAGDTQSAFQLQILDTEAGTIAFDTGKVASTSSSYDLVAGTLTNGKQYQWRVLTYDSAGVAGPFSDYSSFYTSAAPNVTITAPTENQVLGGSSLTVGWSYSDPEGHAQVSYEVQLLDSTGATILADTGLMQGSGNFQTVGYTLANNTTYQTRVTVTNSMGISATSDPLTFNVSYTQPDDFELSYTTHTAWYTIEVSNPATGQAVAYNDLYRRVSGKGAWTRIATGIPANGTYNDYAVCAGTYYHYYAVAVGTNTATKESPVMSTSRLNFTGLWVHDPTNADATITNIQYQTDFKKDQWQPQATVNQFAGRKSPVIEFGEQESFVLSAQKTAFLTSDANWPSVQALIQQKKTLCWRDGRGRKVYGVVLDLQNQDDSFGNVADIEITQVDFTEAV